MTTAAYHVSLSTFEGPFDLLLHLIARRRVDVYDVPLAQITEDYLTVLRAADAVDLDVATDFLVVAATLVELKAARLLPEPLDPEVEELALEARDLLYARLLDYRTFRRASTFVRSRLEATEGVVGRAVPLEEHFARLSPPVRLGLDAAGLAALAARVLADRANRAVDVTHLRPPQRTVAEAADLLLNGLRRSGGRATFADLTAGSRDPADVVVHFLALLELYKLELVDLHQPTSLGDLTVTAFDGVEDGVGDGAWAAQLVAGSVG